MKLMKYIHFLDSISYITCFDESNVNVVQEKANNLCWRLFWNYIRHSKFKTEIEQFENNLDWIWVAKSIKQLEQIVQTLMDQNPSFKNKKMVLYHSIVNDDNPWALKRKRYLNKDVAPLHQIDEEFNRAFSQLNSSSRLNKHFNLNAKRYEIDHLSQSNDGLSSQIWRQEENVKSVAEPFNLKNMLYSREKF